MKKVRMILLPKKAVAVVLVVLVLSLFGGLWQLNNGSQNTVSENQLPPEAAEQVVQDNEEEATQETAKDAAEEDKDKKDDEEEIATKKRYVIYYETRGGVAITELAIEYGEDRYYATVTLDGHEGDYAKYNGVYGFSYQDKDVQYMENDVRVIKTTVNGYPLEITFSGEESGKLVLDR